MSYIIILFLILLVIIVLYVVGIHNRFVRVMNKVDEALSGIDVALAKRYAILTNLQEVVKGYVQYEQMTLESIVNLRNASLMRKMDVSQNQQTVKEHLLALGESYPELKANEQFISLQTAIQDVEDHLGAARRMYNSNVSIFNDLLLSFPSNIIGNWMKMNKKVYFQANLEEKENVQIVL